MEILLEWVILGVGFAGSLLATFAGKKERLSPVGKHAGLFAVFTALILFLCTLPSKAPLFAAGSRLGIGILIGGFLGIYAETLALKSLGETPWDRLLSACRSAFLALFGVGLIFLFFMDYPQPVLGGFLLGAIMATMIFHGISTEKETSNTWLITVISLAGSTLLAIFRFKSTDTRFWWMAPSLILATTLIGTLISAGTLKKDKFPSASIFLSSFLVLAVSALFSWRVFPTWSFFWTVLAGLFTFALILGLAARIKSLQAAPALIVLLILSYSAVSFKFMGGFGIGIGLVASCVLLYFVEGYPDSDPSLKRLYSSAFYIGIGLLLLRLFLQTYPKELSGIDLRAYYTFVALAFGAVLPFLQASCQCKNSLLRLFGVWIHGFAAAGFPLFILVLWGMKAEVGFLMGGLAALMLLLLVYSGLKENTQAAYQGAAPAVMASLISSTLFSRFLTQVSEGTRVARIWVIVLAALLAILWVGVSLRSPKIDGEE